MSLSGVSLASATPINVVPDESLSSSHSTQLTKHDHSMSPAWIPLKLSLGLRITVKILNTLHCALCRPVPSWQPSLLYTTWACALDSEPLVALKSSSSPVSLPPQVLWPRSSLSLEASLLLCLMLCPMFHWARINHIVFIKEPAPGLSGRSVCGLEVLTIVQCVQLCLCDNLINICPSYMRTKADSVHLYP